jgi:hypothetical protein
MPENIQEHMRATLTTLRQHLEAQRNDNQTDYLENHVPHIDVSIEFNQRTLESAHERRNCLQREQHAKQREQPSLGNDALNCLETKMRQPRDDGIVEKWTQYVDSPM